MLGNFLSHIRSLNSEITGLLFHYRSGLELIASKWAHSLIEFDLAWATVQGPLDSALRALADKRDESPLK